MKFFYPAIFKKEEDGSYSARFPDLETCTAKGGDLEDVLENAIDSAFNWIDAELQEDDPELPPASDPEDIPLEENEFVREILVNYRIAEGWEE